ncbi:MAG: cbb3-type cytochrome c oxidase N-terminal domain-containing protein [Bradymonadaceae bacterium]
MNAPTPGPKAKSDYDDVLIEGHEYDGIKEYDNPMPTWWLGIFYVTIAWSIFYVAGMNLGFINDYETNLQLSMAELDQMRQGATAAAPSVDQAYLESLVADDAVVQKGSQAYAMSCAPCHGNQGQGLIGPNLTDNHYIHGGSLMEIYRVIYDGVPAKGMPAWGAVLSSEDNIAMTIFLDSIRGTEPPNPKAPEGKLHEGD